MWLLAVAVIIGVLVLNRTDEGVSTGDVRIEPPATTETELPTTIPAPATTSRPLRAPADVKVLAANGSDVSGLGRRAADRLKSRGYTNTLAPTDTTRDVPATSVQFANDFEPEARAVADALGLPATVVTALDSPPVSDTRGADVVVLIGPDLAGPLGAATTAAPATTAAAAPAGTSTDGDVGGNTTGRRRSGF